MKPLLQYVDAVTVPVPDLDRGLAFYRDVLGHQPIWRNETTDQAQAEDDIAKIRALDLATSGIWIDNPYQTAVSTFDFDPKRYTAYESH